MFDDKVINGGDILLSIEGLVVACATTHTIELTNTVREVSCKGSGDFASAEYGRFSWTASTDALINLGMDDLTYVSYPQLVSWMLAKTVVAIESKYVEGTNEFIVSGDAIITSISQSAPDAENASYSVSLQGRGALTVEEIEP